MKSQKSREARLAVRMLAVDPVVMGSRNELTTNPWWTALHHVWIETPF
jgi:hypothetical protein